MTPLSATAVCAWPDLSPAEEAIALSVLYAALFDHPLTLSELRKTLIASRQTATELLATWQRSVALQTMVECRDGYFFPSGRRDLIDVRRSRETRSRAILAVHLPLLRLIAALPYVSLVALSGGMAQLDLHHVGDVELFVVTRGRRVWSTAVAIIVLATILGRHRTCRARFIVDDSALALEQRDLFTANQIVNLNVLTGNSVYAALLVANPFVRHFYPNVHAGGARGVRVRVPVALAALKKVGGRVLWLPSAVAEYLCRPTYRRYLRRQSARWTSPEEVVLGDAILKLHTHSGRAAVMSRFDAVRRTVVPSN